MPDRSEHRVRYFGYYSNRSRGERGKSANQPPAPTVEAPDSTYVMALRARWAQLVRKVYEVDPLQCPKCGQPMRIIAVIEDPAVNERALRHLGSWDPRPPLRGPPPDPAGWPQHSQVPLTYAPLPDIA